MTLKIQVLFFTLFTVPNEAFSLYNENGTCLQIKRNTSSQVLIIGKKCTESPSLDMLWIRIPTLNEELMNVKILKCMRSNSNDGGKVDLRICRNDQLRKRRQINCTQNGNGMRIWWQIGNNDREQFLHLPNSVKNGSAYAISSSTDIQFWSGNKTTCATRTTYKGTV